MLLGSDNSCSTVPMLLLAQPFCNLLGLVVSLSDGREREREG